MISNILWVTLFLGVTCNTCGVYIYDGSNKYTIQRSYQPSIFKCYFVPTSLFSNSIHSMMRLFNIDILMLLLCLCCSMTLALNFQVVFWTCFWSLPLFVFQSDKTFHVEDATRTQHSIRSWYAVWVWVPFQDESHSAHTNQQPQFNLRQV